MATDISGLIEEAREEICSEYCKWPDKVMSEIKDAGDADDMLRKYCEDCPLGRV